MKNNIVSLKTHRHSVGSVALQNQLYSLPQNQLIFRQSEIQDSNDLVPHPKHNVRFQDSQNDQETRNNIDIESSLESLCIQMMEHALGP